MTATLNNGVLVAKDEGYRVVLKWAGDDHATKYPKFKPVPNVQGCINILASAAEHSPEKYAYMGRFANGELRSLSMRTRNGQTKSIRAAIKNGADVPAKNDGGADKANDETYQKRVKALEKARRVRQQNIAARKAAEQQNNASEQTEDALELLADTPVQERKLPESHVGIYLNLVRMGELDEASAFFNKNAK
jgi:hypothetical protein